MAKDRRGVFSGRRELPRKNAIAKLVEINSSKINATVASAVAVKMPSPPANLNAVAKAEWHFMVSELGDKLQRLDAVALAMYCETYAEWKEAGFELKKSGGKRILTHPETKTKYRNPWLDVRKSARKEMSTYLSLFGLSPHDRARLGYANAPRPDEPKNEFEQFDA